MRKIHHNLYNCTIKGVRNGLSDADVMRNLNKEYGKITAKRMIKSLLLGFADPNLDDPETLTRLAGLTVQCRLGTFEAILTGAVNSEEGEEKAGILQGIASDVVTEVDHALDMGAMTESDKLSAKRRKSKRAEKAKHDLPSKLAVNA